MKLQKILLLLFFGFAFIDSLAAQIAQKPSIKITATNARLLKRPIVICDKNLYDVQVLYQKNSFYTLHNRKLTKIEDHNLSKELRHL
jgi:hypothetical protein